VGESNFMARTPNHRPLNTPTINKASPAIINGLGTTKHYIPDAASGQYLPVAAPTRCNFGLRHRPRLQDDDSTVNVIHDSKPDKNLHGFKSTKFLEDEVRYRLLYGPYEPPLVKGGFLTDAIRGKVQFSHFTKALIPWPKCKDPRAGAAALFYAGI
jgi:hypothetical protein